MSKHITQEGISDIIKNECIEEFDLTANIEIEGNYRIEDMNEGDVIVLIIRLLNESFIKKECQIINSQELLLMTEAEEEIQLMYDEDDEKYFMIENE